MMKKPRAVLLVDDDHSTNFYHKLVLRDANSVEQIDVSINGEKALEYLQENFEAGNALPEFIFLDINMPVMDGWEFLKAFETLPQELKDSCNIVMLTTSINPDDKAFALQQPNVKDFRNKPLTPEMMEELANTYLNSSN